MHLGSATNVLIFKNFTYSVFKTLWPEAETVVFAAVIRDTSSYLISWWNYCHFNTIFLKPTLRQVTLKATLTERCAGVFIHLVSSGKVSTMCFAHCAGSIAQLVSKGFQWIDMASNTNSTILGYLRHLSVTVGYDIRPAGHWDISKEADGKAESGPRVLCLDLSQKRVWRPNCFLSPCRLLDQSCVCQWEWKSSLLK